MHDEEIKKNILSLESMLSAETKKYIHYRSMRNFVLHIDEIPDQSDKAKIYKILSEYLTEIEAKNFDFEGEESFQLANKYLYDISPYYKKYANFFHISSLKVILAGAIAGDSVLYFIGVLKKIKYVPVVTCILLIYALYIRLYLKPKGRVFGMYY